MVGLNCSVQMIGSTNKNLHSWNEIAKDIIITDETV